MYTSREIPFPSETLENAARERLKQREKQENAWLRSMEEHPRCALLPSPELLAKFGESDGSDETDTIKDYRKFLKWFTDAGVLNVKFYSAFCFQETEREVDDMMSSVYGDIRDAFVFASQENFEKEEYDSIIQLAYSNAFAAMKHTADPHLDELVVWYYSGHGLPKDKLPDAVSMPELCNVNFCEEYNDVARPFLTENPVVKGGELCLHHVGFCGLEGLLKPWIAAVKAESQNAPGQVKKNKHLLIILDSCYSGILAEDLQELNKKSGPWNENGCTVTVQAACEPDEVTFGGYFTPCFEFFNQAENQEMLHRLRNCWMEMDDETREQFREIQLPSPKLVTTIIVSEVEKGEPFMVLEYQNLKLNLFKDPGFFKFCAIEKFKRGEDKLLHKRVLSQSAVINFMNARIFKILDYKLKTLVRTGPYAGTPMGLFLLEDPFNPSKCAVCAHIHFASSDTSKIGRINLVHHKIPPLGSTLYIEDHDGLSKPQLKRNRHKIEYAMVPNQANAKKSDSSQWLMWDWKVGVPTGFHWPSDVDPSVKEIEVNNAKELVKACHDFVESNEPGRWADASQWTMKSNQLGVMGLFRKKQRSAWMDKYLEKYGYTYQAQPESKN